MESETRIGLTDAGDAVDARFHRPSHIHSPIRDSSPPIRTSTPLQCTPPQPCMKYDTADCNNTIHRAFNYSTAITKVLLLEPGASIYTSLPSCPPRPELLPPTLCTGAQMSLTLTSSKAHKTAVPKPRIPIATTSHLIKNTQLFHNDL